MLSLKSQSDLTAYAGPLNQNRFVLKKLGAIGQQLDRYWQSAERERRSYLRCALIARQQR